MMDTDWRTTSLDITSKGSAAPKVTSLAGLHERRKISQGQYFTPVQVGQRIWESLRTYRELCALGGKVNVLEPSCGNGALLSAISPDQANLYGIDTDPDCINALSNDAHEAGFDYQFETASIAELKANHFQIAITNPPFSISISHPQLNHYPCNSFGKYGAATSSNTHEYTLYMSLDCADVVAALLPTSMDVVCRSISRLSHIITLPRTAFSKENANVSTAIYFFGPDKCTDVQKIKVRTLDEPWPAMNYKPKPRVSRYTPVFKILDIDYSKKTITTPVTGNPEVSIHHHNKNIVLHYRCGLVEAKVANGLLTALAVGEKLPRSIKYQGDGRFLIDVLLMQPDPTTQLDALASAINTLGGKALISPTLKGYYAKLLKRHARSMTPMQRTILTSNEQAVKLTAKRRMCLIPGDFTSPTIKQGQTLTASANDTDYTVNASGTVATLTKDELYQRYHVDMSCNTPTWEQIHKGLPHHFPQLAKQYDKLLSNLGIHFLAPFQHHDVIEGLIKPRGGYISALEQGSGKARCAVALALAHPGKSLLLVEAGLIPEMLHEINTVLRIDPTIYEIIDKTFDRKIINPRTSFYLASYQTIRAGYKSRQGLARKLRRFFNTVICDEGGLLRNLATQQTRAVRHLAARKLIIFDGTPLSGFARHMLPLSTATAGNGVAHQPFGVTGKPYIKPSLIQCANDSQRGEDVFIDQHVTVQWCTYQWTEDLTTGGRREVPLIADVAGFREWLKPFLQRRVRAEPALSCFSNCKPPVHTVENCEWDKDHLSVYLQVAINFVSWFKSQKHNDNKNISMVAVLAKIAAVVRAANSPHAETDALDFKSYYPPTSKQRRTIEYINSEVANGHKVIVYAQSPAVLQRLQSMTHHKSILYTGEQNITARNLELEEFKHGTTNIVFSSWVMSRGVNLPQCSSVVLYNRHWQATAEAQAIARTQRPSQKNEVRVRYFHLAGSIDEYMQQCVLWKNASANAGLDYVNQPHEESEYQHLDSVLNAFCESVLNMSAMQANDILTA